MKINYTKKEYRLLLDMVEMAEWVLNSHRTTPSDEIEKPSFEETLEKYANTKERKIANGKDIIDDHQFSVFQKQRRCRPSHRMLKLLLMALLQVCFHHRE